MLHEMSVFGLALDSNSSPIVLLKEKDGERILPIWVGHFEAQSIAWGLEGVPMHRPMTHDLMLRIVEVMEARVEKIIVHDMHDSTFYAKIYLWYENSTVEIDARPSDSVALAVRCKSPIYVEEKVMKESSITGVSIDGIIKSLPSEEEEKEKESSEDNVDIKSYLQNTKPEDFGRYDIRKK